jgi:NADH:ubiquinone oxidoreductase subunit F (NADH-binding)
MAKTGIISKLKKSGLLGRSGSGFPTGLKWEMVKKAKAKEKYVICNASSGEPLVLKDEHILKFYKKEVVEGITLALKTINQSSGYIYLRKDLYSKFKKDLQKAIRGLPVALFKKPGGYLAGEETAVCQAIEGKRPEPKAKPPFPTEAGLFGCPTLINNVETFYYVSKIAKNQYKNTRFYTVTGQVKNKGVYELPLDWPAEKILKETGNYPQFDFFVQAGGGACGEILLPRELSKPVSGPGAVIVFNRRKTSCSFLMKKWIDFYLNENCDKCTPCREGVFQISKMIEKGNLDKKKLDDIFFVLEETSLCGLGKTISLPFGSLIDKICKSKSTGRK